MPSKYPDELDTIETMPDVVNLQTLAEGSDFNLNRDAIRKIEAELGTNPSMEFNTVKELLQQIHRYRYLDWFCWTSIDGFVTTTDGAGVAEPHGTRLRLGADAVTGHKAYIRTDNRWGALMEADHKVSLEWMIHHLAADTNQTILLHVTLEATHPPSETNKHAGFKIVNGDLYASNADGATQKITDTGVNLSAGYQFTCVRVDVDPGVNCKFYVNGTLKVTHTDNIPQYGDYYFNSGIVANADLVREICLGRFLLEREY